MMNTFNSFWIFLLIFGVIGAEADEVKTVIEGDSVTLNPHLNQTQGFIQIQWKFGDKGSVIAQNDGTETSYPHLTEIFGGRLQLDHQTGSLTIKNMKIKHSGLYKLQIDFTTGPKRMTFSVAVYVSPSVIDVVGAEMKSVSVMEGDSVTLQTDVTETHRDELIVWRFGDERKLIVKRDIEANISTLYETDERFEDRLKLDHQTGSLTITHTRTEDSGLYTVKISSSKQTIDKRFILTVSVPDKPAPDPGLSSGAVAGIVVFLLLVFAVAAAAGVFFYRRQISELKRKESRKILVTEGESVTLNTETEIQRDDQILWVFRGNLIAQIKGGSGETFDDVLGGRFRGRLKLNEKTGSLTITNMKHETSGLYELQIINSRGTTDRKFSVTVWARTISVEEGETVTLNPETEIQRDDQILWRFRGNLIAQIKGGSGETFDDVAGGRFRGRLKLDEKTGLLTITNMRYEEFGLYELQIINSSRGTTDKSFFVTVWEWRRLVKEGEPATLNTETGIQRDDQILWRFRGKLIAQIKGGTGETFDDVAGGRFRGRLKLDEKTGSLTITNMRDEQCGDYELQIINSRGNTDTRFIVDVLAREKTVKEGESVTLNTETEIQTDDQRLWMFRFNLIAQIKGGSGETFDDVLGERFRGRLKLDKKTGDLTITDMRYEESGLYELQIINSRGNTVKRFFVDVLAREKTVKEGESLTLNASSGIQKDDHMLLKFGGDLIAHFKGGKKEMFDDVADDRFTDRLKLDKKTGSLTIKNIKYGEFGLYKLQIINSRGNTDRRFFVDVLGMKISVTEGESVTLNTETKIQRDDQILWVFRGNLIAQIKGGKRETFDDVLDGRFRGRLKLDEKTGDLTITDMVYEHAGHYKLQIINSRGTTDRSFFVNVKGREIRVKEGEPVTLIPETDIQRDDQILWRFRGKLIAQIKGGSGETFDDVADGRFRGRLKLDEKTGDLTITKIKYGEFGHYKLQIINSSRGITDRRFIVNVKDSTEPSVKESASVVKPQSNKEVRDGERESATETTQMLQYVNEK